MSRTVRVAGAQLGPIQKSESRRAVVQRLIGLMEAAHEGGADFIVYPELALTTFFPRYWMEDQNEIDTWFEREMPGPETRTLFERARQLEMAFSIGYAELTAEYRRFNTQIVVASDGGLIGKYRKVHLPGHAEFDPKRSFQHLEKRYFEPGDLGFPVWRGLGGLIGTMICNDRRWPEAWRVLGLQGVELAVLGYNTPSVNSQKPSEGASDRLFHNRLSIQAGAYQNSTWAVAVAKAGDEDGHRLIGGSMIVDPNGMIVAEAETEADELLLHDCDLDATRFGKETIFDFARHRRIEHYGRITAQTGVVVPE